MRKSLLNVGLNGPHHHAEVHVAVLDIEVDKYAHEDSDDEIALAEREKPLDDQYDHHERIYSDQNLAVAALQVDATRD